MMDFSHEFMKIDADSSLTEEEKVERKLSIQEEDAKKKERSHNLRQLLTSTSSHGTRCRLYYTRRKNCHH